MKRLAYLTIPLLAAAFSVGTITASAADGGTIYPSDEDFTRNLTFSSLTDYAIEDGLFAFADGRMVKIYDDGHYTEYAFENKVTAVDIKDGVVYCGCSDNTAYTVPDQTKCEFTFKASEGELLFNGYYYFIEETGLTIFDRSTKEYVPYEGEYLNLKQYGEKVYAISENKLYEYSGSKESEVVLEYAVDKSELKITIGSAASELKKYAPVQFVEIEEGSFITKIDLDKLDGEYFVPLGIVKTEEKISALRLCESGNATIVAIRGTAYAVHKSKVHEITVDYLTEKPFENAQMITGNIYASPCVNSGTVNNSNAIGVTVTIIGRLENELLECPFYEIEYIVGETTVKGYVAEGFLSKVIIEDNKKPTERPDPEYSERNDTTTVIIIFAVVILVLLTILYLAYAGSKKKKKKDKKDAESKE